MRSQAEQIKGRLIEEGFFSADDVSLRLTDVCIVEAIEERYGGPGRPEPGRKEIQFKGSLQFKGGHLRFEGKMDHREFEE